MTLDLLDKFLCWKPFDRLSEKSMMIDDMITARIDQKLMLEYDEHVAR